MPLVAVRRELSGKAVFFRQVGSRLEYSLDMSTWALAYDFGFLQCISDEAAAAHNDIITTWQGYDGTTGSIAPDIVYDATSADYYRDIAVCQALETLFALYASMLRNAVSGWPLSILENAVTAAAHGAVNAQPLLAYNAASAWRVSEAAKQFGLSLAQQFMDGAPELDEDALARVQCCVYNALRGVTPTFDNFVDALQDVECEFAVSGSSESALLAALRTAAMRDMNFYLSFLDIAQALHALQPVDASCGCDDRWTYTLDFAQPDILSKFTVYSLGAATLIAGVGLQYDKRINATFSTGESFTMIGLWGEYDAVTGAGYAVPLLRVTFYGTTVQQNNVFDDHQEGIRVTFKDDIAPLPKNGQLWVDTRQVSNLYSALFTLRKLIIFGQGVNPFG